MGHSIDVPYLNNDLINRYFESLADYMLDAEIGEHANFIRLYGDLYLFKNDSRKERLVGLQLT